MSEFNFNFQEDLKVDKFNLDTEWEKQPELAFQYCKEEARQRLLAENQKLLVEKLKTELKDVEAKVYLDICENPESYGLTKTTNPILESATRLDKRVQKANKEYYEQKEKLNEVQHELDLIHAAANAITTDKRQALAAELDLWSKSYFGVNNISPDESDNLDKKTVNDKIRNRRKS